MTFRYDLTELARVELIGLVHWIGRDSPERGERWAKGLRERIESLAIFPHRCPLAREGKRLGRPLRLLTYGKRSEGVYRILFEVVENGVLIYSIRHSARAGETLD